MYASSDCDRSLYICFETPYIYSAQSPLLVGGLCAFALLQSLTSIEGRGGREFSAQIVLLLDLVNPDLSHREQRDEKTYDKWVPLLTYDPVFGREGFL